MRVTATMARLLASISSWTNTGKSPSSSAAILHSEKPAVREQTILHCRLICRITRACANSCIKDPNGFMQQEKTYESRENAWAAAA